MTWPGSDEDVATNTVGKPLAHIEMRIADEQGKFELSVCIMHTRYAIFFWLKNELKKETLWNGAKLAKSMFEDIQSSLAM